MKYSTCKHVKISGISYIIPDIKLYIDDDIHFFNNNENKLKRAKKIIGYGTRYHSPDNVTSIDLGEAAAKDLITNLNLDINTIDLIIFASSMPDYFAPASAFELHKKLGLPKTCAAFDITHGCPAYMYAVHTGSMLIESKACKRVLIITGDTETSAKRSYNKSSQLISSAASSATLLEYSEEENLSYFLLGSNGAGSESIMMPAGGARIPTDHKILDTKVYDILNQEWMLNKTYMDGIDVFSFTNQVGPHIVTNLLNYCKKTIDDVDFIAMHQANKQIVDEIAYLLEIPEGKYSSATFTKYGNQMCASSLGNFVDNCGNIISNKKITAVIATYGIGYSWGAMLLNIGNIYCSGIKVLNFDNYPSTEDYKQHFIDYIRTLS